MTAAQIALPATLIPIFAGRADVRGAYGGRGSGKTRSFAKMAAVQGYRFGMQGTPGILLCARQYMNSLDDSSLEECKRAIEEEPFLASYYDVGEKYIKSRDGRVSFAFAGLDRSIASVKSKGRILLCWVDEAEPVTDGAWKILIPTLREEDDDWNAELWVTWNPARKSAAVESRFRHINDPLIKIAELNWRDNPKFPELLERARQRDFRERPEDYEHIWEGAYATVATGAYYAKALIEARQQKRIGLVTVDPLMEIKAFWDIGVRDATAIWIAQFIGMQIRVLNYYEAVGQPLSAHLAWLRASGYEKARCYLPHDGGSENVVSAKKFEDHIKEAGFAAETIANQGKGAALKRVEAARRLFPSIWFNEATCTAGLDALGWYHEKRDEKRGTGLGPEHDWASHGADAFGLMCIAHTLPAGKKQAIKYPKLGIV